MALTVVTGAAGFVGQALARRMATTGFDGPVRLVDRVLPSVPGPGFEALAADLTDPAVRAGFLTGADTVIHLAALPGGASEADPAASRRINLDISLDLIERLSSASRPVRLIYASSIAVLGGDLPDRVDDETPARPTLTYGAHKRMVEIAMEDAVRRGAIDAIALRLPGIVARPEASRGLKSAFMSEVFHTIRAGHPFTSPVGPEATMWLMSSQACADALIHACGIADRGSPPSCLTLPALRVRMQDLVTAISAAVGTATADVSFRPDTALEAGFGRLPDLVTPAADALGFRHDGDLTALVARVFEDISLRAIAT